MTTEGKKDDTHKSKLGLIFPAFLTRLAKVLEDGEKKYGVKDWQKLQVSRVTDAIHRHLLAIERGEDVDSESKDPHWAHIAANVMFLAWMDETGITHQHFGDVMQDDRRWAPHNAHGLTIKHHGDGSSSSFRRREGLKDLGTIEVKLDTKPLRDEIDRLTQLYATKWPTWYGFDAARPGGDHTAFAWGMVGKAPVGGIVDGVSAGPPTIADLQKEVVTWADAVIGKGRTYENAIRKLAEEELKELLASPKNPLEFADVMILVLDLAHLGGIDIVKAVQDKMKINRQRKWAMDSRGLYKHVQEKKVVPAPYVRVRTQAVYDCLGFPVGATVKITTKVLGEVQGGADFTVKNTWIDNREGRMYRCVRADGMPGAVVTHHRYIRIVADPAPKTPEVPPIPATPPPKPFSYEVGTYVRLHKNIGSVGDMVWKIAGVRVSFVPPKVTYDLAGRYQGPDGALNVRCEVDHKDVMKCNFKGQPE